LTNVLEEFGSIQERSYFIGAADSFVNYESS